MLNSHLFKDLEVFLFVWSFPLLNVPEDTWLAFYYKCVCVWGGNTNHMSRLFLQHHSSNIRCTACRQLQSADNLWLCSDICGERGVLV